MRLKTSVIIAISVIGSSVALVQYSYIKLELLSVGVAALSTVLLILLGDIVVSAILSEDSNKAQCAIKIKGPYQVSDFGCEAYIVHYDPTQYKSTLVEVIDSDTHDQIFKDKVHPNVYAGEQKHFNITMNELHQIARNDLVQIKLTER